jgi:hypothetical protein
LDILFEMMIIQPDKRPNINQIIETHIKAFAEIEGPHEEPGNFSKILLLIVDANERAINLILDDAIRKIRDRG